MSKSPNYSIPEPAPIANNNPSIHDLVIEDIKDRKQFGLEKYDTILQAGNGRESLTDAYQEILDLSVYLRQFLEEQKQAKKERDALVAALSEIVKHFADESEENCYYMGYPFDSIDATVMAMQTLKDCGVMQSDDNRYYRFVNGDRLNINNQPQK